MPWYYPAALLGVTFFIFAFAYCKVPATLFSSDDNGLLITGSRTGLYDPEYISYDEIMSVEQLDRNIDLRLKNGKMVALYFPKRYRANVRELIQGYLRNGK